MKKSLGLIDVLTAIVKVIVLCALSALLTGWITMLLWNWLMPTIFGLGEINFFQGWGLTFLCGMLFPKTNRDA